MNFLQIEELHDVVDTVTAISDADSELRSLSIGDVELFDSNGELAGVITVENQQRVYRAEKA